MNIQIPDSWLREYLETEASYRDIAELLTLHGPTVEKVEKTKDDVIYHLEVTPNRSDLLSVIGLARETAAILQSQGKRANFKPLKTENQIEGEIEPELPLKIKIDGEELISAALAVPLKELVIKPSPAFIKERLEKSGMRSLNNVIDISNYVMLETGMPLHIFDYDSIEGALMTLRESKPGESVMTLDGVSRKPIEKTILIEDEKKIIDLCGIMGGENSAVKDSTTRGVLLIALYNPLNIRRTFRQLNLATDAALRFEKYIDPTLINVAFNRTLELLGKHANAKPAGEPFQTGHFEISSPAIDVELPLIQQYLGERLEMNTVLDYLKALGLEVEVSEAPFTAPKIKAYIPSHRAQDLMIAEDIVEEVARLYGFDKIQNLLPPTPANLGLIDNEYYWEEQIKDVLVNRQYLEVYDYSFVSLDSIKRCLLDINSAVEVTNPINQDLTHLRPSLLCNLLSDLVNNQHKTDKISLFALERVSRSERGGNLPSEEFHLTATSWQKKVDERVFYKMKADLNQVFRKLNLKEVAFKPSLELPPQYQENRSAEITLPSQNLGIVGFLNPQIVQNYGLQGQVVAFDLLVKPLVEAATSHRQIHEIINHSAVVEDISVLVALKTLSAQVADLIRETVLKNNNLSKTQVKLKDIYEDEKLNKTSLTFTLEYQAMDQTPKAETITAARENLIKTLEAAGFEIRKEN